MRLPFGLVIDPSSFVFGLLIATIFWWVIARARPLWRELGENLAHRREEAQTRRMSTVEQDHRRITLRRAQGMHLAAPLFALDEILIEPRLLAPAPRVEPGSAVGTEDAVTLTLPYMPAWPELAAIYGAPTFTLGEALSGGRNLVVIGQPGTGKTVALAHLASLCANRSEKLGPLQDSVPFMLHVADLKLPIAGERNGLDRIIEVTSEEASVLNLGKVPAFVQGAFRSGRALLILDGFDELTSHGQSEVSGWLGAILKEYPKTRIVTSGAPEHLDGLAALGCFPLTMAAWNQRRQAEFIRQWSEVWARHIAAEAWVQARIENADPLVLESWLNMDNQNLSPLELTLKVWAAYAGDAPGPHLLDSIAAHIRRLAPANTPSAALESLAMEVMLTAQPLFDPHNARAWVKEFELPEEAENSSGDEGAGEDGDREVADEVGRRRKGSKKTVAPTPGLLGRLASSGLLVSYSTGRMRFVHPVFGGYLAGRALSGYKAQDTLLNQPDWIGKLLAMRFLASQGEVGSLVAASMLEWSRLPMQRPLFTAARWLRDSPPQARWRGQLMSALALQLQTEGLPIAHRAQALSALATSEDPGAAVLFRQFLNTLSFELMALAALGSGAVRDVKAVASLIGILETPSSSARRAACLALVSIGTTEALEAVAKALLHGDEELRRAAAESLANDPGEGHAMLKDGATMKDLMLRRAVVYGLARVHEPWADEMLESIRVDDDQWVIRNSAHEVLESRSIAIDPRIPRPLKPPSQSTWLIAFAGTQGVGISPGAPATDILLAALKSPKVEERLAALEYLKQNPTDGIIKGIYGVMFGDDSEAREAAYLALWEIGASGYKLPHPSQFGFG
jgi:HEAT repeat protein